MRKKVQLQSAKQPFFSRLLQSTQERQIRIHIEYGRANNWVNSNPNFAGKYNYSKRLLDTAKRYYQEMLKVKSTQTMTFDKANCNDIPFPAVSNMEIDLYVLVDTKNDDKSEAFATAVSCFYDTVTHRPIKGIYELNLGHIVNSKMNFLLYFSTFVHEFAHIIFFSEDLFKHFRDVDNKERTDIQKNNTDFGGEKRNLIIAPEVLTYAREYFNDNTLIGVPLENGGGSGSAGSHWEKAFMPTEFMNPTVEYPGIVTQFTLLLAKASGWYTFVDMGYTQAFTWGKGVNDYHKGPCPTASEYCSAAGQAACSPDYRSKATCTGYDNFMGNCKYKKNDGKYCLKDVPEENKPDATEAYGATSRCFLMSSKPKCLKASCDGNNVKVKLASGGEGLCDADGKTISINGQDVTCPGSLADFCSKLSDACPDDCSGNGVCLSNKKCFCIEGFSGDNCSTKTLPDPSTEVPPKSDINMGQGLLAASSLITLAALSFLAVQSSRSSKKLVGYRSAI
eukprot:GABU01005238.1.p1 GENE.GABU01005238.1~~GABU01005238.1.p1  ORF type:complete len:534 (-),score=152.46 GABU01005238.1:21-1541(-)